MLNFTVETAEGSFGAYLTGQGDRPRPGVILLQEIFGVNDAMRLAADNLAAEGFVVLAPDLFHQHSPGIALGYSESDREIAIELWQGLNDVTAQSDIEDSVRTLRHHRSCTGHVGAVGFCLGGKYALLAASDGIVEASVSFYPVKVPDYAERLRELECPVQVHLGDNDAHIPPEVQTVLRERFNAPPHEYHLHEGAGHGFYNAIRHFGYHPEAAASAHAHMTAFLKRHLIHDA